MSWNYHWRTRPAVSVLEQTIDQLRTENIRLRRQIESKQGAVGRLKILLRERLARIDELNGQLEQSRLKIQRLGLENAVLAAMIAAPPRSDFAVQSDACWPSAQTVPGA